MEIQGQGDDRAMHNRNEYMCLDRTETSEYVKKQHILIYAHYYELAATGQLLRELAEGLLTQFKVTVIAAVPSYLGTVEDIYKKQKYYFENHNGVDVIRVRVPESQKGHKISRIKNILVYFLRAIKAMGKMEDVDYVMGISQPPILGGLLGVYGKWRHSAKEKSNERKYRSSIYLNKSSVHKGVLVKWTFIVESSGYAPTERAVA